MSKYSKNTAMIDMTIKVGDYCEIINIFRSNFNRLIKLPKMDPANCIPWEHVYDIYIQDFSEALTEDNFTQICNMIGDIFILGILEDASDIENMHVLKFVDKYILPYTNNFKEIANMLADIWINPEIRTDINIFPDTCLEYTSDISSNCYDIFYANAITNKNSLLRYEPTGTLNDAYIIYRYLNGGVLTELSHMRWFKSLKLLLVYFNLDHIIKIYRKPEEHEKLKKSTVMKRNNNGHSSESEEETIFRRPANNTKNTSASSSDEENDDAIPIPDYMNTVLKDCPIYSCNDNYEFNLIILSNDSNYVGTNSISFNILYVMLKTHISKFVLPEYDNLLINMNDFMTCYTNV